MKYKYKTEYRQGGYVIFPKPVNQKHTQYFAWLAVRPVAPRTAVLSVPENYQWDGCTMAKDWAWNKRGSLMHDALYQYAGQHHLSRQECDYFFFKLCLEDSHEWWEATMAGIYYLGLRLFGAYFWNRRVTRGASSAERPAG